MVVVQNGTTEEVGETSKEMIECGPSFQKCPNGFEGKMAAARLLVTVNKPVLP